MAAHDDGSFRSGLEGEAPPFAPDPLASAPVPTCPSAGAVASDDQAPRWTRWLAAFRAAWWRERTPLRHLLSGGERLVEGRLLKLIVGLAVALVVGLTLYMRHTVQPSLGAATPYVGAGLAGAAAGALVWLLGHLMKLLAHAFAWLIAWGLVLVSVGAILYGTYLILHHAGVIH